MVGHQGTTTQLIQQVDDQGVGYSREQTKVSVIQAKPGPNIHNISNRGNPGAGTVYPINAPIDDKGVQAGASIDVSMSSPKHHYVKMNVTNANPVINLVGLMRGITTTFTLDITNGIALTSLTITPTVVNLPTLSLANGARNVIYIVGHSDITIPIANIRFEAISGAGGGGNVPDGTIENQHAEWDQSGGQWLAVVESTYGATGPFATGAFLNFANDSIILAARNVADDGNIELKIDSGNFVDWTRSDNQPMTWQLRSQHASQPDQIMQMLMFSGTSAVSEFRVPTILNFFATSTGVFNYDQNRLQMQQNILPNADGTLRIGNTTAPNRFLGFFGSEFGFDINRRLTFSTGGATLDVDGATDSFVLSVDSVAGYTQTGTLAQYNLPVSIIGNFTISAFQDIAEIGVPADPAINTARLYAKDVGGLTRLFYRDSVPTEIGLGMSFVGFVADALLDMATFSIVNIDVLEQDDTGHTLLHTMARNETLADDVDIGEIRWRSFDGLGSPTNYASIFATMESDVNASEEGSLNFTVQENGVPDVLYMKIDGSNLLTHILMAKELHLQDELVMGGNTIVLDTNLTTSIDGFTANTINFLTNSAPRLAINDTTMTITNDVLLSGKFLFFQATTHALAAGDLGIARIDSNSLQYNVPTGYTHHFSVNDLDIIRLTTDLLTSNVPLVFSTVAGPLSATEFGMTRDGAANLIINTDSVLRIDVDAVEIAEFGASFLQFPEVVSDPAAGTTSGKYYVKVVGGLAKPFFIGDGTAAVDLSSGGGSQTPWLTQIDADDNNLINMGNITFGNSSTINESGGGIIFDVLSSDSFVLRQGGSNRIDMQVDGDILFGPGTGADLILQTGGSNRLLFEDVGNMTFTTGSTGDIRFLEGATEVMLYDASANTWDIHPTTAIILGIGTSDKVNIGGSTVQILSNATSFTVDSATTNFNGATINLGADAGDTINFRGDWAFDFTPNITNTYDIGTASLRVREIFSNNVLNVSFSKFKQDIIKLDDGDCMAICGLLDTIEYKWNDLGFVSDGSPEQEERKNRKYVGYNADPLTAAMPNAVAGDMIYSNAIIGVLLGAVRHLQERILQLEA